MLKWLRKLVLDKLFFRFRLGTRMIVYFLLFILLPFGFTNLYISHIFRDLLVPQRQMTILTQTEAASKLLAHEGRFFRSILSAALNSQTADSIMLQRDIFENHQALLQLAKLLSLHTEDMPNSQRLYLSFLYDGILNTSSIPILSRHPKAKSIRLLKEGETLVHDDYIIISGEKVKGISFVQVRRTDGLMLVAQLFVPRFVLMDLIIPMLATEMSELYILNPQGEILASTRSDITGVVMFGFSKFKNEQIFQYSGQYNNKPVMYSVIRSNDLFLVMLTPEVEIESIRRIQFMFAICTLLVLLIGGGLMLSRIYREVQVPLQQLSLSMNDACRGQFDAVISYHRNDEFLDLMAVYQHMLEQIRFIIDEMLRLEKTKRHSQNLAREAEVKALQAQINPHMLYNTLDSINWMALKHGARDVSKLILHLANYFRYSLSKGNDYITFAEELKQIDSYLFIQCLRLGDKLEYRIDFPDDLLPCYTIKLIMQPFVENCIVHAFVNANVHGIVKISAVHEDNDILLTISDNGVGADVNKMQEMIEDSGHQVKHYGMRNVAERLRLCFGDRYCIRFSQNDKGGLTVSILLPVIHNLEQIND